MDALEKELVETSSALPEVSPVAESLRQKAAAVKAGIENSSIEKSNIPLDGGEKKKRGRPPKVAGQEPKAVTPSRRVGGSAAATPEAAANAAVAEAQRKEVAIMAINLVEQSGTMLGGEAAKMRETEKLNITDSIERYMVSKNISDIPPGLMLSCALAMYYSRAIQSPEATPKIVRGWFWIKDKFSRRKKFDARSHSRHDSKRENDAGEETGQALSVAAN